MNSTPVAVYLEALFREIERLSPTSGVSSHGIVLGNDNQLRLLFVCGDVVILVPLRPGDLDDDPVAAAAELHRRASAEARKDDVRRITYKT